MNTAVLRRAVVPALLLFQTTAWAQDLETPWRNYLSVDARLEVAVATEQQWREQQHQLQEEIRKLQASQSWYNGWIVEIVLARNSARQVELADSLRQIHNRIADLKTRRDHAFLALREVYQRILLEAESEDRLSLSQKEQALTIGRRLLSQGGATFDLPDYSSILNSPYENEAVKRLVLADLQSVLQAKLVLIDSLLTEKETELALLARLNEFHRDLSYQLQSNLDLEPGSPQEPTSPREVFVYGWGEDDASTAIGNEKSERANEAGGSRTDLATPLSRSPAVSGETNIPLNGDPIGEVIKRLKTKRQQYQDLLRQIETELPH
ncbi:MAG: hypothetical protein ACETWG_01885 [Candidatus Neomarinimicrobiota bacterium]